MREKKKKDGKSKEIGNTRNDKVDRYFSNEQNDDTSEIERLHKVLSRIFLTRINENEGLFNFLKETNICQVAVKSTRSCDASLQLRNRRKLQGVASLVREPVRASSE